MCLVRNFYLKITVMKKILIITILAFIITSCQKEPLDIHVPDPIYPIATVRIYDIEIQNNAGSNEYIQNQLVVEVVELYRGVWCNIEYPKLKWNSYGTLLDINLLSDNMGIKFKPINSGDKLKSVTIDIDTDSVRTVKLSGDNLMYSVVKMNQ